MFQNTKIYKTLRFLILLGILFVPTFFYTNGFYKDANIRIISHYQQEFIREKRVGTSTTKEKVKHENITLEMLTEMRTHKFSDYGDKTCGDNPHKKRLKELFVKWSEIASQLNISYFISTGTLLGAWRNGDLIPYDTDVDVMISDRDNLKLEKIQNKRDFHERDEKFHLILQRDWKLPYQKRRRFKCNGKQVKKYSDHCSFQEPLGRIIKGKFHLDIYDYRIKNGLLYDPSEWPKTFPIKYIFPLKTCKIMSVKTFCPKRPTKVLYEFYGSDLRPSKICKNGTWVKR